MIVRENVLLSSLTTFRIGGTARYVLECISREDVQEALTFIRERSLAYMVLGGGSNVLASDDGYDGAIILMKPGACSFNEAGEGVDVVSDAGVAWDEFVRTVCRRNLWGIENLAGIPGTVGAAPVQNIGAYGADVSKTIQWVEVLHAHTGEIRKLSNKECRFAYRDSIFKKQKELVILRVSFLLTKDGKPNLSYKDLSEHRGEVCSAGDVADVVRTIRSRKFPDLSVYGTAGSFFKNPYITQAQYATLAERYPNMPSFAEGSQIKIPLAWILDSVLSLKGYGTEHVRLFERQPLVIVSETGATKKEVDELAQDVERKVFNATHITIEREVQEVTKNFL